jgi:PBP1b-binding outer membrane lipoprotein LpoB
MRKIITLCFFVLTVMVLQGCAKQAAPPNTAAPKEGAPAAKPSPSANDPAIKPPTKK